MFLACCYSSYQFCFLISHHLTSSCLILIPYEFWTNLVYCGHAYRFMCVYIYMYIWFFSLAPDCFPRPPLVGGVTAALRRAFQAEGLPQASEDFSGLGLRPQSGRLEVRVWLDSSPCWRGVSGFQKHVMSRTACVNDRWNLGFRAKV